MCQELMFDTNEEREGVFQPSTAEEFVETFLCLFNHEAAMAFENAILEQDGPVFQLVVECDELTKLFDQASRDTRLLVTNRLAAKNWTVNRDCGDTVFEFKV